MIRPAAWACALLLAAAAAAQQPYTNPVIKQPGMHAEVPDPFVLKFNGEYFLYTSGDPITAYHSHDLVRWNYIGPVLSSSKEKDAWNQADVWAPEVVYRGGKFYMYYTATRKSDDWRVMEAERRVGVAVANSPSGPFVDSGKPLTCTWAIDGHVLLDPDSGEEFLFYSILDEEKIKGAGQAVDRMLSPTQLACEPGLVTDGGAAWEDKDADPANGAVRYTNEGPTVLKRDGRFYVLYSGGSWDLPTYNMGYAWSDAIRTGSMSGPPWNKVVPPILRSTPIVQAPGHNSVVKAPNNVDDINVYHARTVPFVEPWNRMPFADRIFFHHQRLFAPAPTTGWMAPPARPRYSSLPGHPAQVPAFRSDYFVYEINARAEEGECHKLAIGATTAQFCRDSVSLGGQYKPLAPLDALRQFLVTRNGSSVRIMVDGVNVLDAEAATGGQVRFLPARAELAGYTAVTLAYRDNFQQTSSRWESTGGAWNIAEAALTQSTLAPRAISVKGEAASHYEFSASLRSLAPQVLSAPQTQPHQGSAALAGIVAAYLDREDYLLASFDHDYWPFARFRVRHISGGKLQHEIAVPMQRGFDYAQFHTIRVARQGSAFTFYLDGAEIAAAHFAIGEARPGLFTENASASFAEAEWTRLETPQNLLLNASFDTEQWDGAKAVQSNPWTLTGSARANECCAHSGLRRLLVHGARGSAAQSVPKLAPGRYRLHAFVIAPAAAAATLGVSGAAAPQAIRVAGETWKHAQLDFTVPAGGRDVTITFSARPAAGQLAAADDFYLHKLEDSDDPKP